MSDISVLTQEYETTSKLSETIDRALIELKKMQIETNSASERLTRLRRSERAVGTAVASGHARSEHVYALPESSDSLLTNLAIVLEQLIVALDFNGSSAAGQHPQAFPGDSSGVRIPLALAMRLRDERRGDLDYFLEDVRKAALHLKTGMRSITNVDVDLLDHLATVADAQTTALYRRLMRR